MGLGLWLGLGFFGTFLDHGFGVVAGVGVILGHFLTMGLGLFWDIS